MIVGTHVAFASVLYLGGAALFEYKPDLIGWALAASVSILPDADLPTSKLGRVLWWFSSHVERHYGHRTITHSLFAICVIALLASPLLWLRHGSWFWAILGGYWSHLWIDMANHRGIDLFWPSPIRVVMPANPTFRLEVGSKAEMVLLFALVAFALALYPISGMGFRTGLQRLLGSFEMAQSTYLKGAGTHWYTLELTATDRLTLERINCRCPIVASWHKGLIVEYDNQLRTVGKSETVHNLYPVYAGLHTGPQLRVVTHRIDMAGHTLGWLRQHLPDHTHYLSGELLIDGDDAPDTQATDLDRYQPVRLQGDVLRLYYARAQDVDQSLDQTIFSGGTLYLQIWLAPEDKPIELRLDAEDSRQEQEELPEVLRRYLGS